ncbi:MAG TPA: NAD(+)/NADH kinase, partial [Thermoplasmata archaeon]|nr:NAD(+)/NADH kinase [Thermoplasmata archaeon]
MSRIGFLVNPIAGMGGRVGLKGTDHVAEQARAAGAQPVAPGRASLFLAAFTKLQAKNPDLEVRWLTCAGEMGAALLNRAGIPVGEVEIVHTPPASSSAEDTRTAARAFEAGRAELVLVCGGDGTARDVVEVVDARGPILGIPAGVK